MSDDLKTMSAETATARIGRKVLTKEIKFETDTSEPIINLQRADRASPRPGQWAAQVSIRVTALGSNGQFQHPFFVTDILSEDELAQLDGILAKFAVYAADAASNGAK